ncbi:hypothetical protein E5676_scaffold109G00360 [Cucumis melo var. makuwa]|uniref:Uncharacterized protein n=1 Tax=Cucumis melo var. makuwa TaxID=1194695 RepID=A0A5D3BSF3_CUCMM|nr:hypothetical protein E6C27_scaffold83G00320 [Cucumis melo var. makuwa]TYK01156.1 hypothetical protein E5676_scaffold109G00360 [Cucumis melo var. makuwa]
MISLFLLESYYLFLGNVPVVAVVALLLYVVVAAAGPLLQSLSSSVCLKLPFCRVVFEASRAVVESQPQANRADSPQAASRSRRSPPLPSAAVTSRPPRPAAIVRRNRASTTEIEHRLSMLQSRAVPAPPQPESRHHPTRTRVRSLRIAARPASCVCSTLQAAPPSSLLALF